MHFSPHYETLYEKVKANAVKNNYFLCFFRTFQKYHYLCISKYIYIRRYQLINIRYEKFGLGKLVFWLFAN